VAGAGVVEDSCRVFSAFDHEGGSRRLPLAARSCSVAGAGQKRRLIVRSEPVVLLCAVSFAVSLILSIVYLKGRGDRFDRIME